MNRRGLLFVLLTPCLLAPSCPRGKFEVRMEMMGEDRIFRQIAAWTE